MKRTMKNLLLSALLAMAISCLFAFTFTANAELYSGECGAEGDNVTWELDDETGVFTLKGEGKMADKESIWDFSYGDYIGRIKTLVIGDDITRIGSHAFEYTTFTEIQGGKGIVDIGSSAFDSSELFYENESRLTTILGVLYSFDMFYDTDLKNWDYIYLSEDVKHISENFFYDIPEDTVIFYEGSAKEFNKIAQGYSNPSTTVKYNHTHTYNIDYDSSKREIIYYCDCNVAGKASDAKVKNLEYTSTDAKVTLKWDRLNGAAGYKILMYDTDKAKWVNVTGKGTFAHEKLMAEDDSVEFKDIKNFEFSLDGLKPYTDYKFAVRPFIFGWDDYEYVPKYATITAKTNIYKPELTVTGGYNCIRLDWSDVDGADGYIVYKRVDGSWKVLKNTTSLTYTESGLSDKDTCTYAVKAYKVVNGKKVYANRYASGSATAKLPNPKVTYEREINSITLKWDKATTVSGYRIYCHVNGRWKALKTTTGATYTITGLKANTKYTFAVRTYKKVDGAAKWASSYTKVIVTTLNYTPIKATGLKGEYVSASSIKLSWNKVEDAQGYYVYMYNSSTKKYTVVAKTKALTAVIDDVVTSKNSYFAIKTYKNVDGKVYWSGFSAKLKVTAIPSSSKAVEIFNCGMLDAAYWWGWKPYNSEIFDYDDNFYGEEGEYARIKSNKIKSADDLKKHLYKYLEKDLVDKWVNIHIIKKNGSLYYMIDQKAGGSGGIDLKYTKCLSRKVVNGKLKCNFYIKIYEHSEDKYYEDTETATFILQDGRWVLEDQACFFYMYTARWTDGTYNPYDI